MSPSLYEALRDCRAKALWIAHGERSEVPSHPATLLGTCFHDVVAAATSGRLDANDVDAAAAYFDRAALDAYDTAHPLIRAKFASPQKIPYYFLMRERAAVYIHANGRSEQPGERGEHGHGHAVVETALRSRDGLVVGRPDWVDVDGREVIDFKTGRVADDDAYSMSPREERQLRLYVGLALENEISVERGVIVRASGQRVSSSISEDEARGELEQALAAMRDFNEAVECGVDFAELAQPSLEACRFCPCIPFCEPFWRDANEEWVDEVGAHAEGIVRAVGRAERETVQVVALAIEIRAGTLPRDTVWIEHIPETWLAADGSSAIQPGNVVRLVDLGVAAGEDGWALRADRIMTAVWRLADADDAVTLHAG